MEKATVYRDKDANLAYLSGKNIGIIGYGNQGRAQALNMRDSGVCSITVGSVSDSSAEQALEDGFEVHSIADTAAGSDILFLLLPDEVLPDIYASDIAPNLKDGAVLNFSSGYNITYKHVIPPANVDVILLGPRMIGRGVRDFYVNGKGFPAVLAIHQDYSGGAFEIALALAKAIGATHSGVYRITFDQETYVDLFSEQAVWPLIYHVIVEAFNCHLANGIPSELSLLELYVSREAAFMLEKASDVGLFGQMPYHSRTSRYGQMFNFNRIAPDMIRDYMAKVMAEIKDGTFDAQWQKEQAMGAVNFAAMQDKLLQEPLSVAERRFLRISN